MKAGKFSNKSESKQRSVSFAEHADFALLQYDSYNLYMLILDDCCKTDKLRKALLLNLLMKKIDILLFCLIIMLPSSVLLAQTSTTINRAINSLNTVRDSQLTWDEIQLLPAILREYDADNNGSLDSNELGLGTIDSSERATSDVILAAIDQNGRLDAVRQ